MKIIKETNNKKNLFLAVLRHLNIGGVIRGMDTFTLATMCLHAQSNGNLPVSRILREKFQKELNMTTQSLTNSIARLREEGLITGERGFYVLKPEVLWDGDSKSRIEFLTTISTVEIVIHIKKETNT